MTQKLALITGGLHRVGAVAEFVANALRATLRRAGGRRRQPLPGDQCRDVFDLIGGGLGVDTAGDRCHHRVRPESLQHRRIPVVGAYQQIAVALKISGQPGHGLLQPQVLGQVV